MITGNRHATIISYIKLCVVPPGDVVVRYDVGRQDGGSEACDSCDWCNDAGGHCTVVLMTDDCW